MTFFVSPHNDTKTERYFELELGNRFDRCPTDQGPRTLWRCSKKQIKKLRQSAYDLQFDVFQRQGESSITLVPNLLKQLEQSAIKKRTNVVPLFATS